LTCCLPDGDNSRSVQVYFNDYLKVQVWTRNSFEDFEYKDFISLVKFLLDTSYTRTISFLCDRLNVDCDNIKVVKRSDAMKKIKSFEERTRLKKLIESITPENYGVIIRTVAEKKMVPTAFERFGIR
jgi:hypothetical protein